VQNVNALVPGRIDAWFVTDGSIVKRGDPIARIVDNDPHHVWTALEQVAIAQPQSRVDAYPHELSGGMRQRVMISMAISNDPAVLIADEPTTALDVTVQAQIMDLLGTLRRERNLALVLITHDLGVVAGSADRVAVMYAGRVVETGDVDPLFEAPAHPYTRGLLECLPRLDTRTEIIAAIPGVPVSPLTLPPGCPFAPRCRYATAACTEAEPALTLRRSTWAACPVLVPLEAAS
jgi:oligopeptide/dipeptide ABC transporter ATP-binding protein